MEKRRILIVESDDAVVSVLGNRLIQNGHEVVVAREGQYAIRHTERVSYDLILLSKELPGIDGIEVCRRLRSRSATSTVPIVMLAAQADELDELVAFSVGADDYVRKPFSVDVLLHRIQALFWRQEPDFDDRDVIATQGIVVDRRKFRAFAGDTPLRLTKSEFGLLEVLVQRKGRALTRDELIEAALGDDALVLERTIDVHIRALRKKLGSYAHLIETVRSVGYRFHDPRSESSNVS